jgi:hypothetical protein
MTKTDNDENFKLDPSLNATDPKIIEAIRYWSAKRGERLAPARADLNPREIKTFLPNLQIFEIIDGGRAFRPRLMGTAIIAAIKEDTTNQVFDGTSARPVVQRTLRAIRWVLEHKKPLRTFAQRTAVEGQDFLAHETAFLPLSNDGKTIDMVAVVGVFSPAVS